MNLLNQINRPQDLLRLSEAQLPLLCQEIRDFLVETVSQTGGHLAPSLGVVELTVALHRAFNSPTDKLIWDVGHQAYVHKILTGRREKFHTLRQLDGISGFPKPQESEHDAFATGHSSTSISAALGMALARDLKKEQGHVVAIIGDGSLTGGQAYEALNHAGHTRTPMTVILNDNEMSIAKNVGAIAEYLAKMRTAPSYAKVKRDIEFLLKRIPAIGDSVLRTVERLKDSVRYLLVPGMLFEELGFTYLGPIDGHDLPVLEEVLEKAKRLNEPVLVHVITCKGKGYTPAECNADKFHGVGPFCVDSGEIIKSSDKPSYTKVFGETIVELAAKDENIVAITAAMPEGTGLKAFSKHFPARFFDVGIAEQHAVTLAAGMAANGLLPVVALYSTFGQRAYDQILHDVCLQNAPVIIALDRAGIVGDDGPTHHGVFDYSYLRHIPNMVIMAPKDENELRHMLFSALQYRCPVSIRYPRGGGLGVDTTGVPELLPFGKWEEIKNGEDVTFLATGAMVEPARAASEILWSHGIRAGVVNARFIKPFDEVLLMKIAEKTKLIITVEDQVIAGGFGSGVLEFFSKQSGPSPHVKLLGFPDTFVEHGKRPQLMERYRLTAKGLAESAQYLYEKKNSENGG
ncbi:1-deoxy-D-xylulose-5-phosphate synthase [Azotosporobacter soli]|uniref:1-deoxy-D-xylulose-5-phosphate synthase n=1 Tax=Azotosporobacter soli TaxID=3055040 RepID=UPI0031FEDFFD